MFYFQHLRFCDGVMVTCSKDRSIAVWDMVSQTEINLRRVLVNLYFSEDLGITNGSQLLDLKMSNVYRYQCDQIGRFIWTLGNYSKPLPTINLPKSPSYLGNFCKGVKIFNFSSETILGNFYRHLAIFFWSH